MYNLKKLILVRKEQTQIFWRRDWNIIIYLYFDLDTGQGTREALLLVLHLVMLPESKTQHYKIYK